MCVSHYSVSFMLSHYFLVCCCPAGDVGGSEEKSQVKSLYTCPILILIKMPTGAFSLTVFPPPSKPTAEVLTEYTRKVDFLKGLLEAEKLVSWSSNIWVVFFVFKVDPLGFIWSLACLVLCQPSPTDKALANQFLAPGRTPTIANERMSATKTVHMQTKGRCTAEMRDELLDTVRGHAHLWSSQRTLLHMAELCHKLTFVWCVSTGVRQR